LWLQRADDAHKATMAKFLLGRLHCIVVSAVRMSDPMN
jgi:hypothetical protein